MIHMKHLLSKKNPSMMVMKIPSTIIIVTLSQIIELISSTIVAIFNYKRKINSYLH